MGARGRRRLRPGRPGICDQPGANTPGGRDPRIPLGPSEGILRQMFYFLSLLGVHRPPLSNPGVPRTSATGPTPEAPIRSLKESGPTAPIAPYGRPLPMAPMARPAPNTPPPPPGRPSNAVCNARVSRGDYFVVGSKVRWICFSTALQQEEAGSTVNWCALFGCTMYGCWFGRGSRLPVFKASFLLVVVPMVSAPYLGNSASRNPSASPELALR